VRWRGPGERDPARVWCRAGRLPDRGRGGWGGARRLSGERAADVGEDGPHDGRVLHDGDDAQPAASFVYDERGWRATFYTTGMEHSPTSATGHWMGTDAVACDAAGGVGRRSGE
jgi:hypothetical protein